MLASVLIMASGAGALAATGDLIRSGTTGACKYEVTGTVTIKGVIYHFDENGVCLD